MRIIRSVLLAAPLLLAGAAAPGALASPVDVTVTDEELCVVDTGENDGCTVPAQVAGVVVTVDHHDSPVWCVAVIADCPQP